MKKSIFESSVFHFKNFKPFFNNSTIIRIRKKRQKLLQNKDCAKYIKAKINDQFVK